MDKPFNFKKFHVHQSVNAMKIGTDGVLLGAACSTRNPRNILDIGAGTGVVALMLAQRTTAAIDAVEIDTESSLECEKNFLESPWNNRLKIHNQDVKDFNPGITYDLIVCNPPFFPVTDVQPSRRSIARSQSHLTYKDLVEYSTKRLKADGIFSVILPFDDQSAIRDYCKKVNMHCFNSLTIKGRMNSSATRILLEFGREEKAENKEELTIELSERHAYSPEYLKLMSDFLFLK